jgi:tetratricopeptide (TPR) repeat protein
MSRRLSRLCWLLLAGLSVAPALAQASGYTVRAGGVIVDRPPRPEVIADLGTARQLAQARDYQAALPMYLMLAASDPNDAEMAIEVARVLGFADRNAESAALYRRVLAQAPQRRSELLPSLAWQTAWAGDAAQAEPLFLEVAQASIYDEPVRAEAWRGAAESRQNLGRLSEALEAYDRALALKPDDRNIARKRAQMLLWTDRHAESISAYQALAASDPADRLTQLGLAQALNFAGRHRQALAIWRDIDAPASPDEKREVARGLRWAGFEDLAHDTLQGVDLPDAAWLRNWRTSRETARSGWAAYEWARDRDSLIISALTLGGLVRPQRGHTLEFAWRRASISEPAASLDADRLTASYGWRLGDPYTRWGTLWPSLSVSANRYAGWSPLTGAARLRWIPRDGLRLDGELGRETIENTTALANRVTVATTSLAVDWRPLPRWNAGGSLALLRFDDGNVRTRVTGRADYALRFSPKVVVGMEGQLFSSSDPTSDSRAARGYWNPKRYNEARAYVGLYHDFNPWELQARVGVGVSREVDGFGNQSSGNPNVWELSMGRDITPTWRARFYAGGSGSNFAAGSGGSGYWRRFAGASITGWL